MDNNVSIALDELAGAGIDVTGLRESPYSQFLGQRIAVYGPNFIWRGRLVYCDRTCLVLDDVYQIRNCDHDAGTCDDMRMCDRQVFQLSAVCNAGPVSWA